MAVDNYIVSLIESQTVTTGPQQKELLFQYSLYSTFVTSSYAILQK